MKKYIIYLMVISFVAFAETLFEIKDASDNKVLDVSTDGLRVFNMGDTLMVISADAIRANIGTTQRGLSRSFSVTTTSSVKGKGLINALEVDAESASMTSPLGQYTDFSPENIFIGLNAGIATDPYDYGGHSNVFLGNDAGVSNVWGAGNIYIGMNAGNSNVMGGTSVMIGANAGKDITQSEENIFIGHNSGGSCTGGDANLFLGAFTGGTSGSYNVLIGHNSGTHNTGDGNVFIGYGSGYSETCSNKLCIENNPYSEIPIIEGTFPNTDLDLNADLINLNGTLNGNLNTSYSGNNYFRISAGSTYSSGLELFRTGTSYRDWRIYNTGGNLKFGVSVDDLATVNDVFQISYMTGNVGIGSTTPSQKFDVYGGNGRVESGYSWLTSSDARYKKNITTLENSLDNLMKMRGVRYDLNEDTNTDEGKGKHIGFIAQELEQVYDELVVEDEKGYKSVAYDKVSAILVEALKEQQSEIEKLNKKLEEIERKLNQEK